MAGPIRTTFNNQSDPNADVAPRGHTAPLEMTGKLEFVNTANVAQTKNGEPAPRAVFRQYSINNEGEGWVQNVAISPERLKTMMAETLKAMGDKDNDNPHLGSNFNEILNASDILTHQLANGMPGKVYTQSNLEGVKGLQADMEKREHRFTPNFPIH